MSTDWVQPIEYGSTLHGFGTKETYFLGFAVTDAHFSKSKIIFNSLENFNFMKPIGKS